MFSNDFKSIVLNSTRLIDVRAPIEFEKGSFPYAINLPLINDKERHEIGICYKKYGNNEAVKLGHRLVSGAVKEERVKAWSEFIKINSDAKLFCFRGGQRSKISQEWLSQSGYDITRFRGGYKAFRNYLINEIEKSCTHFKPIILGGRTGSGKTILLNNLDNSIDFEGLANHRGSSFGRKITPQPSQINFENALAYDLIQKLDKGLKYLVFEDEGNRIGSVFIPKIFADYLLVAPLIILETHIVERIGITFNEYVFEAQKMYGNNLVEWRDEILGAMSRIKKRLGSQRYQKVCDIFENAFDEQMQRGSQEAYKEWIEYLLREYYDPMYDYQIQKRSKQVEFRGSSEEVVEYLSQLP
ncbi:tRNA 2-selenouridine synthase [Sulfurimonas gotlandica GD1]|jgi:tRNA 2-selenouridine synthase|uniref:tRNA 2-selenouridine synthase n=1 Tax=Sulfurimonas gotlandica (strain DSM 19862 / JCM 16533 / GD1) TaxID=929558 RepID=B6BHJ7_SULGG|nr:tRNA 2-selenouridine(34) synthase MnmH [Sulfurimonas gotlandica]EDZ63175.1 tRNA 2-selenouridine synthase [Sulfurimonas gotlandica GD1]EHP29994.1 tRNA 2-selenouridine synthase [Sulfurimonas gotlandica GD1]